jgi:siroheme synthase (precorrin-2 oxidase/ferrochelatase)
MVGTINSSTFPANVGIHALEFYFPAQVQYPYFFQLSISTIGESFLLMMKMVDARMTASIRP